MVTVKSGKPPKGYTDAEWQQDLIRLKDKIQENKTQKKMTVIEEPPYDPEKPYYGKTQYQCYCDFINDILDNIRSGGTDYCFYIYQIAELLKYQHDLQAVWSQEDECFILSL